MESVETINSTLQNVISICKVLLCYIIPLLLVIITALTFTSIFSKWRDAVINAKNGFIKTAEAVMNGISAFFGLFAKKYSKWVMLGITIAYIICVIVYLVYQM